MYISDSLTIISTLASTRRRLKTAGHIVSDQKAIRVFLTGLNQDIFESFIASAERTPYASYDLLVRALQQASAKPHMIAKLRKLLPGRTHSTFTTRTSVQHLKAPNDQRLDRI